MRPYREILLPNDFRGWVALGLFAQSSALFVIIAFSDKELSGNQGFMTLAAAVIVTGWIGGVAAFAYAAGKNNAERSAQVDKALEIAQASMPPSPPSDAAAG